jgi:hypothetical protein
MTQPYETIALAFAQHLIDAEFALAHALLNPILATQIDQASLQTTYQNMVSNFAPVANHVEVIEALSDWPGKLASDVAWVYVSIDNGSSHAEAVSVTLESTQNNAENAVKIRLLEWGRP